MPNKLIGAALLAAAALPALAASPACPSVQVEAADAAVDGLDSWPAVARFYRHYRACDDGGIAAGSADAIAKLLGNHWNRVGQLAALERRTPGLSRFVVAHLNSTLDTGDLERIAAHARRSCPAGMARFCRRVRTAATAALR